MIHLNRYTSSHRLSFSPKFVLFFGTPVNRGSGFCFWTPHPIFGKTKRNRVQITGSRATVSVSSEFQSNFYPRVPLEFVPRRAVEMAQARRLASTLNGLSLTSGELSRIDLPKYILFRCRCIINCKPTACMCLFSTDQSFSKSQNQDGRVFSKGFY